MPVPSLLERPVRVEVAFEQVAHKAAGIAPVRCSASTGSRRGCSIRGPYGHDREHGLDRQAEFAGQAHADPSGRTRSAPAGTDFPRYAIHAHTEEPHPNHRT